MAQMYNPDEIISKANGMKEQSTELKSLINDMTNIVCEMRSVWQSPAQQRFTEKFEEIEPQLSSFCTNINSFAEKAIDHAKAVRIFEEEVV